MRRSLVAILKLHCMFILIDHKKLILIDYLKVKQCGLLLVYTVVQQLTRVRLTQRGPSASCWWIRHCAARQRYL